jgi:biotin synthase
MTNTFPNLMQQDFSKKDITAMLGVTSDKIIEDVRFAAEKVLLENCGNKVYFRGLIEFSNFCRCDCYYCGIRKSNKNIKRYEVDIEDVLNVADWCVHQGYGSMVIQAGERRNKRFIGRIIEAVKQVKEKTCSDKLPHGLGITLSVGEQTPEVYRRFFEAGAHRYLLRIETTNPELFAKIHPVDQTIEKRIACLRSLREIGYQVGTGVMVGLPGQTLEDLAEDILFFKRENIDMIGMGPFIPNEETPLGHALCLDGSARVRLALLMIAATRLVLKDVNIASTTALQALDPWGREKGLRFGANVMMPLMTPKSVRENYILYPGKPGLQEESLACHNDLIKRIKSIGRDVVIDKWGDSLHFRRKR